jgi:hypothetical protein
MCPVVMAAATVGLAVAQGVQQNSASKARAKSANKAAQGQEDRRQENARNANENFEEQIKRTRRKVSELKEGTAQDLFDNRTAFLKARGQAMASAGSAGVEGVSINDMIADFAATTGRRDATTNTNLQRGLASINDKEKDLHATTMARRQSIPPPAGVEQADPTAGFLTIAQGAVKAGQGYSSSKPKTFTPTSTSAGLSLGSGFEDASGWAK